MIKIGYLERDRAMYGIFIIIARKIYKCAFSWQDLKFKWDERQKGPGALKIREARALRPEPVLEEKR